MSPFLEMVKIRYQVGGCLEYVFVNKNVAGVTFAEKRKMKNK